MVRDPLVIHELKRLAAINGGVLQPRAVVEAARDAVSPLHRFFTWDDSEAAEKYRLQQARQLLSVAVEYEPRTERHIDVFASLPTDRLNPGGGYRLTVDVLSDDHARAQLLHAARDDMRRFVNRYRELTELADLFQQMQALIKDEGSPAPGPTDERPSANA